MSESKAAAWQVSKKGLPPVTLEKKVVDVPEPRKGEVLVEVHASALNPGESAGAFRCSRRRHSDRGSPLAHTLALR